MTNTDDLNLIPLDSNSIGKAPKNVINSNYIGYQLFLAFSIITLIISIVISLYAYSYVLKYMRRNNPSIRTSNKITSCATGVKTVKTSRIPKTQLLGYVYRSPPPSGSNSTKSIAK